ncbi:MAG TPA: alpha/beta hydrolase [Cyclobacteriaceae bacterium]|nr:alpha/beta hydrolase [Cyclobacteriaceae bacterium]
MRLLTLFVLFQLAALLSIAQIPYGNNPSAGKYFNVGDAKLYYEIYGTGAPIVLLHGGVYGGIDEFEPFITRLSEKFQVICIATRGHGKSEIGKGPFTWQQRGDDAYKVIRSITKDSVMVLGFSDGGFSAYKLAASYPDVVKRMIVIGAGDRAKGTAEKNEYSKDMLLAQSKEYFENRLKIMPEPDRWNECLGYLNKLYNDDVLSTETFSKIKCPTLIMAGDRDHGHSVEKCTIVHRNIKNSQLSIVPDCGHVVFYCNFPALWESMKPFIGIQ